MIRDPEHDSALDSSLRASCCSCAVGGCGSRAQ